MRTSPRTTPSGAPRRDRRPCTSIRWRPSEGQLHTNGPPRQQRGPRPRRCPVPMDPRRAGPNGRSLARSTACEVWTSSIQPACRRGTQHAARGSSHHLLAIGASPHRTHSRGDARSQR
eukprot:6535047-Prymnesium_polylepis.1